MLPFTGPGAEEYDTYQDMNRSLLSLNSVSSEAGEPIEAAAPERQASRGESFCSCGQSVGRLQRPNPSANLASVSERLTVNAFLSWRLSPCKEAAGKVLFPAASFCRGYRTGIADAGLGQEREGMGMYVFFVCFSLLFALGLFLVPVASARMSRRGPFVRTTWSKTVIVSVAQALVLASFVSIWLE